MIEISDSQRSAAPYNSICYITCEWADGSVTRASGVVVGANDVLTAHHVVFDATRGGYATHISISPGADTWPASTPFGTFSDVAIVYARSPDWDPNGDGMLFASESQNDIAVLGLRSAIGNTAGWVGVSALGGSFSGTMDGYPARGTGLMEETVTATPSSVFGVFDVADSLGPGASGGPLLRYVDGVAEVVGVLSSGDSALTHSTYAALFGTGTFDWLQAALLADNVVMTGVQSPASGPIFQGGTGAISFLGSEAADVFRGSGANEHFLGYGGEDTAVFSGPRGEYFFAHSNLDTIVNDARGSARDGGDTLVAVERAAFADMTVNLEIGRASLAVTPFELKLLEELYVAFFNRIPEADGLQFWIGQVAAGSSISAVADGFYSSALAYPAQTGYGPTMSNGDFVDRVYRNVLDRPDGADADGFRFWTGALADGSRTRGDLVNAILQSAHTFKGNATWGWVADLLDNRAAVAQHFAVELGLNYNTPEASIAHGMDIAAAVTPASIANALALIGVSDTFSTLA